MFSTFTGASRRPRTVNLSGQAGNPFANTSWTPSNVSNATKTVSDAQVEREKRQIERQKLKAAANIQRTWRGHRVRRTLADSRRASFDELYRSAAPPPTAAERLPAAFNLLLSFFSPQSAHDIQRTCVFARDCESAHVEHIAPRGTHNSRLTLLAEILVRALSATPSQKDNLTDPVALLKLISRLIGYKANIIEKFLDLYYDALARLFVDKRSDKCDDLLFDSLITPLRTKSVQDQPGISALPTEMESRAAYKALALSFFTHQGLRLFERPSLDPLRAINVSALAAAIQSVYGSAFQSLPSRDDLLWLLAHFISLGRISLNSNANFTFLNALMIQLTYLSPDISIRISLAPCPDNLDGGKHAHGLQPLDPFVSKQLLSLVDYDGISHVLQDFSSNLAQSAILDSYGTSLLAGYILNLLRCFPDHADDTRMRLFLGQIPTSSGSIPTIKFLWQIMRQTTVFLKLQTGEEAPLELLRRYLRRTPILSQESIEEQEWRVVLLFLELYTFILRLSDDEDFFSGMKPQVGESSATTSRLRQCSLSLKDVETLTMFLKTTAFVLHYKARELSQPRRAIEAAAASRLDSYLGIGELSKDAVESGIPPFAASTKLDLDDLRAIITTALKMLYERDSRKRFLPANHWLMDGHLEQEGFISAVIEEERRSHEEQVESDEGSEHGDRPTDDDDGGGGDDLGSYSTQAGQRLSRHARLERFKAQQIRAQRERRLAEMGPKLEVLKHMPFVVPFETRVQIFRQFIYQDRIRRDGSNPFPISPFSRHHAKIKRGQLFEDAFQQFYHLGDGFKDSIHITFVDQFDAPEAGIDGGGVTKEFLIGVTTEAFDTKGEGGPRPFSSNEQGLLFPNPTSVDTVRESLQLRGLTEDDAEFRNTMSGLLMRFEFLGRIVGKCLYEGILVDLAFAGFFLLKWSSWSSSEPKDYSNYKGSINDLREMDKDLYKGLLQLKNYPGDVSELGFDFTITDQVSPPGQPVKTVARKLMPNGDQMPVTNDNRLLYISYAARHRLVVQPRLQTAAFLRGLRSIIRPSWLSMFNQSELQRLVGGDSSEIDVDDLRRNTIYSGLYEIGDDNQEHPTVKLFWKVMEGLTDHQKRDVLKYVSSTPRAPLLGFSQLRPKFSIRDGGTDERRLPSTSTCVNLLKLPRYSTEATLREKLLYAVSSGAGFDLS